MSTELIMALAGAPVFVAVAKLMEVLIGRYRTRGDKQTQSFKEMQVVVAAYKEVADTQTKLAQEAHVMVARLNTELNEATHDVVMLRTKVVGLETALESAYDTISRMMDLVKTLDDPGADRTPAGRVG